MTMNKEPLYWSTNKDWYIEDPKSKYGILIKDNAPDRAKKSFKMWIDKTRTR